MILSVAVSVIGLIAIPATVGLLASQSEPGKDDQSKNPTNVTDKDPFPAPQAQIEDIQTNGIILNSRAVNGYFYTLSDNVWKCTFLKGVNMGLTLPDTDLNNPDIPYQTYMEWFGQIKAMNANTIKVFTVMNPDFYRALSDFNQNHADSPLLLLQGLWINENDMYEIGDAYGQNGKILTAFKRTAKEICDIINGNSDYTDYGEISPAIYDRDVSQYVAGYILGLEWSPDFISNTNQNNPDRNDFQGDYLYTKSASPFEAFLCQVGNYLIAYETQTYHKQHPVAFLNWSTTDVITHTNEPFPEEDAVSLNTENICATDMYYPGLFAAVDVYPYYPEFLNYQKEYTDYIDPSGKKNPYRAYLKDLQSRYSVPVIIAEVGLPTSRGSAHTSVMGYHQGGIDEVAQGEYIASMLQDIAKENYAGAMIFSWQDEWFKQTWNTIKFAPNRAKNRTPNVQSAEQSYGIVACQPGEGESICYPDGDIGEWEDINPTYSSDYLTLWLKADTGYLYIMGKTNPGFQWDEDKLAIAIKTTDRGNQSAKDYSLTFDKPVDFLVVLNGQTNSRILTDAYYDSFYFQYCYQKKIFARDPRVEKQNSGLFQRINTFISNEIVLPVDQITIEPKYYESGLLKFGNANPQSKEYDSLSDFYYDNDCFEIRIPWYLLNVLNVIEGKRLGDFYQSGRVAFETMGNLAVGGARITGESTTISLADYDLQNNIAKGYHMRLKKSYSIISQALKELMKGY